MKETFHVFVKGDHSVGENDTVAKITVEDNTIEEGKVTETEEIKSMLEDFYDVPPKGTIMGFVMTEEEYKQYLKAEKELEEQMEEK